MSKQSLQANHKRKKFIPSMINFLKTQATKIVLTNLFGSKGENDVLCLPWWNLAVWRSYREVSNASELKECRQDVGIVADGAEDVSVLPHRTLAKVEFACGRDVQKYRQSSPGQSHFRICTWSHMCSKLIIIIITIIIIIIIELKGTIRDFFTISSLRGNCLQHTCSCGPGAIVYKLCATDGALIMCNMSCATWCKGTAQLLSLTELKSHLFELYIIG